MSIPRTILRNLSFVTIAEILTHIISFLLIVIISRLLGSAGLGKYSFAFAFVGLFAVISDFGICTFSVRAISRDKEKAQKYFSNYFSLKIILSLVALILPITAILLTNEPLEVKFAVSLASFAMVFNYISYTFRFLFNAFERFEYQSIYLVSERVIAIILGIFILLKGYGLILLISTLILSNFVGLLITVIITAKKFVKIKLGFDFKFWKFLILGSLPFWLIIVFRTLYFRIDTVMLSFIDNYVTTGIYTASYRIIGALTVIPVILTVVIYPVMSRLFQDSKENLKLLYEKSLYFLFLLAFPIVIGITLLADRFIMFVYSNEFTGSTIALQILVWAVVFIYLSYLMGFLLNAVNLQNLFTITMGVGAVINIILNLLLIPRFSYIGASFATLLTEIVVFFMLLLFTYKHGYKITNIRLYTKPILASLLMGVFIPVFSFLHLFIIVPLSAILYFYVLYLIKGIMKEDIEIIRNAIYTKK